MVTKENGMFTDNALKVLEKRYLLKDINNEIIETPKEMFIRISKHIAKQEEIDRKVELEEAKWEDEFDELEDYEPTDAELRETEDPKFNSINLNLITE